jgi:hypothetical protein
MAAARHQEIKVSNTELATTMRTRLLGDDCLVVTAMMEMI